MSEKWRNWADTERSRPVLTVSPRRIDQVVLAVQRARETRRTVKPIGASHSFSAVAATDGIRLDMSRMRGLVDVDFERSRVTLWAGTHLWELPSILNPLGFALPNLGDIDRQTMSGATSTGTHGTGLRLGGLSTSVVEATLVTGTGEVLAVSEHENQHLLPAVALGIGALGVLLTLTIQCVPRFLLHAVEATARLDEVLDSYEDRNRSTDHFEFFWFPHTTTVRTKTNTRKPFDESSGRSRSAFSRFVDEDVVNNWLFGAAVGFQWAAPRTTPRINRAVESVSSSRDYLDESHRVFITKRRVRFREMEYSVPLPAVPTVMRELRDLINRRGFLVSFPVEVRAAAADSLLLSTAHERESGYIAVHRYWRDTDHEYFREAGAVFRAHEGRPHWGKMHTMNATELRSIYAKFDDFAAIRDELDPDRVFANPYLNRVLGS